jgi:F0F1-type ATP synthase epsilon subunit
MNVFTVVLQDLLQQWRNEEVESFIAQDPGGSFGIQAHHETLVTCLLPGLARLRIRNTGWLYIAQPGSVVVFRHNALQLATSQFILSEDREQLLDRMEQAWQAAKQGLQSAKTSYAQVEQALTRKLWEMNRQGNGYA